MPDSDVAGGEPRAGRGEVSDLDVSVAELALEVLESLWSEGSMKKSFVRTG